VVKGTIALPLVLNTTFPLLAPLPYSDRTFSGNQLWSVLPSRRESPLLYDLPRLDPSCELRKRDRQVDRPPGVPRDRFLSAQWNPILYPVSRLFQ
jgi:hypothetical protein